MRLAIRFADIIIKIRKEIRPKQHEYDEDIMYGVIDDTCVYTPEDGNKTIWTNGTDAYQEKEFEVFLRKK